MRGKMRLAGRLPTIRRDQSVLAIAEVIGKTIADEPRLIDEVLEAARILHSTSEEDFDADIQAKGQAARGMRSSRRRWPAFSGVFVEPSARPLEPGLEHEI